MKKILLFLFSAVSVSQAIANDGIAAVSIGGIVLGKTDDIAMKREVLNVSWNKISVDYDFLNESASDKKETVIFPLPEYTVYEPDDLRYSGEPERFSINVDGRNVPYTPVVQAFFTTHDKKHVNITKELESMGLTKDQFIDPESFDKKKDKKAKRQLAELVKRGYLSDDSGDYRPEWSVQISYEWEQIFPTGKIVHVHHEYRPFASAGPAYMEPGLVRGVNFCQDKNFIDAWKRKRKEGEKSSYGTVSGAYVSYILQTGNTWKNGIEDFTLNLRKESPDELVTLCFPSDFKRIDDKTLQTHIMNFHPEADLDVYFANIDTSLEDMGFEGNSPKAK